jgi:hypothetical protein
MGYFSFTYGPVRFPAFKLSWFELQGKQTDVTLNLDCKGTDTEFSNVRD